MCTRYPIINRVSELKVHIELTRFVQPEKIEIDANERAVNEKSQYCFFVCTTFDSFLNDLSISNQSLILLHSGLIPQSQAGCPFCPLFPPGYTERTVQCAWSEKEKYNLTAPLSFSSIRRAKHQLLRWESLSKSRYIQVRASFYSRPFWAARPAFQSPSS